MISRVYPSGGRWKKLYRKILRSSEAKVQCPLAENLDLASLILSEVKYFECVYHSDSIFLLYEVFILTCFLSQAPIFTF